MHESAKGYESVAFGLHDTTPPTFQEHMLIVIKK